MKDRIFNAIRETIIAMEADIFAYNDTSVANERKKELCEEDIDIAYTIQNYFYAAQKMLEVLFEKYGEPVDEKAVKLFGLEAYSDLSGVKVIRSNKGVAIFGYATFSSGNYSNTKLIADVI